MNIIPFNKILIKPNRQRQEFAPEALQELKTSIETSGLFHPPVLRKEGPDLFLVAGERRLRAIEEIFALGGTFQCDGLEYADGIVPYVNLGELSELEAEEAELDENLRRKDLTWQEHAAAVERLHKLRVKQKEEYRLVTTDCGETVSNESAPAHTVADTAQELTGRRDGAYQDTVRKELIVARHLSNPAVAGAKDVKEAFKILKQQELRKENIARAEEVGKTFSSDLHQLFNTNCIEVMRDEATRAPEYRFDVICTDPPYGMGADEFGDAGGKMTAIEHEYKDDYESWKSLMSAWCPLSFAITKPQAHAYVFCDFDRFHELKSMMQTAGWYVFRTPIINHKLLSGRVPLPDCGPRRQYELVLYAIKGNKPTTHIYPDVLSCPADEQLGHGAQKPVAVFQNLLQRSVRPGDRIFDGFVGTGPVYEAAHTLKCVAVGCELSKASYGIALQRLQRLKSLEQPTLGLE